ncbi:MAG: sugar phosphate isomerase/epimerase family protein [Bacteroidota bacterium]
MKRRSFLQKSAGLALGSGLLAGLSSCGERLDENKAMALPIQAAEDLFFKISLAQWSLHRAYWSGERDPLDFAIVAREEFGLNAIEYVNQFFMDKAKDMAYLKQLKQRADDHGVQSILIMIDAEGSVGSLDASERKQVVENHKPWVDAAKYLGCHAIRVNAAGKGDAEEVKSAAAETLNMLCDYADQQEMNIVIENHGGYSSDAAWLSSLMRKVDRSNCGTLPDFGNFTVNLFPYQKYDTYQGMEELMPFAKGVSAKTHEFDPNGQEKELDFRRILSIVKKSGFDGHIGIEYEGYKLSEVAGIRATLHLLQQSAMTS